MIVEVPGDVPVSVSIARDGAIVGPEQVRVGSALTPMTLDGTLLNPGAIEATWADMQSAAPRQTFGVYVWYEAGAERIRRQDLDPEMLEALRGHGYLGD